MDAPETSHPTGRARTRGPEISDIGAVGEVGWNAGPAVSGNAGADVIDQGSWLVARLWSTPATLTSTPLVPGRYRFVLTFDGEATIERRGGTCRVAPRQLVLLDGQDRTVTRNPVLWARMEWHLPLPLLDPSLVAAVGRVADVPEHYAQLVAAVTNTVSTDPGFADGPGGLHLLPALQALVAGGLADAYGAPPRLTPTQHAVLVAARRHIDEIGRAHV